jgi:hypothetical protein
MVWNLLSRQENPSSSDPATDIRNGWNIDTYLEQTKSGEGDACQDYFAGWFASAANASTFSSLGAKLLCAEPNLRWAVPKWSRSSRSEL